MTSQVKASQARKDLFRLMGSVEKQHHRYILTRDGKPQAVLMGVEEFDEWLETLEVLTNKPLMKKLQEARKDLVQNKLHSHEEVFGKRPPARG